MSRVHRVDSAYLGWSALAAFRGSSLRDPSSASRVRFGFETGNIGNCSYAAETGRIGVSAEDRTNGGQVVAVVDAIDESARVLLRRGTILHHTLDPRGSRICVTVPSAALATAADLCLLEVETAALRVLLEGVVSPTSVPQWLPDARRIAFEAPDGRVLLTDLANPEPGVVASGESIAVSPDGRCMALRRGRRIFTGSLDTLDFDEIRLPYRYRWRSHTGGLSWSRDGALLSVGFVKGLEGKRTRFALLDVRTARCIGTPTAYLNGLVLI